ncbi:MAG: TIGR01906 family membrane protein [Clostridiales Family XIII bacterium]|jgi:integral membrane protein (TIGR01906 family)|nr:TIGR01906 family membrane protein [Clostridiales Family XIII bacterium]
MTKKKTEQRKHKGIHLLAGAALFAFIVSFAVVFSLFFKPLYHADVKAQGIPAAAGMSEEEVYENYDALIAYNFAFGPGELEFPTLPMSESGRVHFAEVKNIFVFFQILLAASAAALAALAATVRRKLRPAFLVGGGAAAALLPAVLGILAVTSWDSFFTRFHETFFGNDLWMFDYRTDPVILILPDSFFFHCAVLIMAVMLLLGLISAAAGLLGIRRSRGKAK